MLCLEAPPRTVLVAADQLWSCPPPLQLHHNQGLARAMNTPWTRWLSRFVKQPVRDRREKNRRAARRPLLETLEERLAPATNSWIGLTSANWVDAGNWSLSRAPLPSDDLV